MKKVLFILIIILSFSLLACKTQEEEIETKEYTLNYSATPGGYLVGGTSQVVKGGESGEWVEAISDYCYEFSEWSDGNKNSKRQDVNVKKDIDVYAIFNKVIFEYPLVVINTNNSQKITSKEEYIKCNVSVTSNEYSEYELTDEAGKIKGRGNSTWGMPKKPYKLKFDNKVDFLGLGKAKTFTLIANYCDKSLLRNYLAYKIGANMNEIHFTTSIRIVEVVLNGEYIGLYTICEQSEVKENRVELDTTKSDSFFIELDSRAKESGLKEGFDYFTLGGKMYVLKFPDPEEDGFTSSDLERVKDFFEWAYNVLMTGTYEEIGEVLDLESFASTYIIYELFNNVDVGFSSWYLYRDSGSKIGVGPIWDFDISCGNCNYNDNCKRYNNLYAKESNPWYKALLQHDEFKELVKNLIEKYRDMIANTIIDEIDDSYNYEAYYLKNFERWDILGKYDWPNPREVYTIATWRGQVEYLETWLFNSLNYICKQYGVK